MRESRLLSHIYARSADLAQGQFPAVVLGPGDDCALVRAAPGGVLLTVDHLVEGRHYPGPLGQATSLDAAARKAVARSVSDIAAMAGEPRWALATAALPDGFEQARADALFDALSHWARHFHCPLVGGDISSLPAGSPVVLSVTVGGDPHPSRGAVRRDAAKPGDHVYITGRLGGSLPSGRHLTFEPRVTEARWLADHLGERLHAMIDLSDGLGRDAARVAAASKARLVLNAASFPLHAPPSPTAPQDGEDYELLFTAHPEIAVPATCPTTGTPITRIGRVEAGTGCVIIDQAGKAWDATELGWDH
jgi:thiamine-monophosphate kinase